LPNKKGRHISFQLKRQPVFSPIVGGGRRMSGNGGNNPCASVAGVGGTSALNAAAPSILVGIVQHSLLNAQRNNEGNRNKEKGHHSKKHSRHHHRSTSTHTVGDKKNFAHTLRSRVFAVDGANCRGTANSYRSRRNQDTLIVSHGDQHMMSQRARSMVFSHFRHMRSYRGEDAMYTCSSFLSSLGGDPKHLLVVGQEDGAVTFLNMWNTKNYMHIDAHTSSIDAVETSRDQRIVLTNGTDGEMKLWDATRPIRSGNSNSSSNKTSQHTGLKLHATFQDCFNPKFSHDNKWIVSSHIVHEASNLPAQIQIGQRYRTTIHDIETKVPLYTLEDMNGSIMYRSGSCCFHPLDQQVFCDGQLFDLKSNALIHRFDRLGENGHAVFHPRRSELIVDSAVWDLRMLGRSSNSRPHGSNTSTSKLLNVVPALKGSISTFSYSGDALYTYKTEHHDEMSHHSNQVVRVLDGWDKKFADIGQPIELEDHFAKSLCTDLHDDYIAITVDANMRPESYVKLYEVGRRKPNEADSDMDDAQSESEAPDMSEEDEFGFDDDMDDMYYDVGGNPGNDGLFDDEPDMTDFLYG
jgi:HIV-1 Vpr-binding protein